MKLKVPLFIGLIGLCSKYIIPSNKSFVPEDKIHPFHTAIYYVCRLCGFKFRTRKHNHFKQHGLKNPIKGIHFVTEKEWDGKLIKRIKRRDGDFKIIEVE